MILYQGKLEAAKRNTRSSDLANPSICTNSSVFMRLLPSCSLLQRKHITQVLFIQSLSYPRKNSLARVVQTSDSVIKLINHHPADTY